jgi:hypothetical protein
VKRKVQFIIASIVMMAILTSCNNEKSVSEHYVSIEMERTLYEEDYEAFSGMLKEDFKNKEETFNKLKDISIGKNHATFKKIEIIEYDNEMLIVYLTVEGEEIKISEVKVVPTEMADTVKKILGNN